MAKIPFSKCVNSKLEQGTLQCPSDGVLLSYKNKRFLFFLVNPRRDFTSSGNEKAAEMREQSEFERVLVKIQACLCSLVCLFIIGDVCVVNDILTILIAH